MAKESKYRDDKDLSFLQYTEWQDLKLLADTVIADADGNEQWTGDLKNTLLKNMQMYPESEELLYQNSWKAIAAEIQLFGGDTVVNLFRQKGVPYEEILKDVAKKIEVDFQKSISTSELEEKILRNLFGKITTLNDLNFINETLKNKGYLGLTSIKANPKDTLMNSAGKGALFGVFAKTIPILAPIGTALIATDITAPAYRVTIPVTCIIAMLRKKYAENKEQFNEF